MPRPVPVASPFAGEPSLFRCARFALFSLLMLVVAACSGINSPPGSQNPDIPNAASVPPLDDDLVSQGADLYQETCASCHGADLSGQDEWKSPNLDGSYPAPPHDSSGHTWHHSDTLLLEIVRDGLDLPESRMPTFGDQLSDGEVLAILEFLKSNWGEEERAFQWQVTQQDPPASS